MVYSYVCSIFWGVRAIFTMITAAAAPGLALLSYFYLKDRYRPEPLVLITKLFILGFILVFPALAIQRALSEGIGSGVFISSYILAGTVEEFLKFFIVYYVAFKHVAFDEPYDGIIYSVAVSLGFATFENILYLIVNGVEIAFVRALLPVSGHALFAVLMGFYIGKAKFSYQGVKAKWIVMAIISPILAHGTFNFILMQSEIIATFIIIPYMVFLWVMGLRRVKIANNRSPFRFKNDHFGQN